MARNKSTPAEELRKNAAVEAELEHLQEDGLGGFEQLNADVTAFPFIRVLQDLSPQLKKSKPEYLEDAESGMLYNTVSHRLMEPPVEIVVGKFERAFIQWKPDRGGFVAAHEPDEIERLMKLGRILRNEKGQLYSPENGNLFQENYIYYVVFPDYIEDGVCLLSLTSTQLKEARRWNRLLLNTFIPGTGRRAMPYFLRWNITTPEMKNDKGDWRGLKVEFAGFVGPETLELVTEERKALPDVKPDLRLLEGGSTVVDVEAESVIEEKF
jgi:hypothetical protein